MNVGLKGVAHTPTRISLHLLGLTGVLWSILNSFVGLIVVLFMLTTRDIEFARREWLYIDFVQREKPGVLQHLFRVWDRGRGLSLGVFNFYHRRYVDDKELILHERRHTLQSFVLGPFWLPMYVGLYLWIKFFDTDRDPYYHHPFEVDARRRAGEQFIFSKEFWYDHPHSTQNRHPQPVKKSLDSE